MDKTNFERVRFDSSSDVKPIVTNIAHTYPHWHEEVEVVFACKGPLLLERGIEGPGSEAPLLEGEIAVVNSAETHAVNSFKENNAAGSFLLMLQFSRQFFHHLHADIDTLRFGEIEKDSEPAFRLRTLLLDIIAETKSDDINKTAVIHGLSGAVTALLIKHLAKKQKNDEKTKPAHGSELNSDRLKRMLIYINEHYYEDPSLNEIAEIACFSPSYFSHQFAQAMGMSYSQYLNYIITEIMGRHGFNDVKNFNKVFKIQIGCSPTEYRKMAMSGDEKIPENSIRLEAEERPGSYIQYQKEAMLSLMPEYNYTPPLGKFEKPLQGEQSAEICTVDVKAGQNKGPLDRYFFAMTGAARASDFLRKGVQEHFRLVQKTLRFRYVRFHGIFNDEMCVINGDGSYNWIYVDEVFDFLLETGLKPFPEFSFMPQSLASGSQKIFFYEANVTPPSDYEKWSALVESFVRHCVERYTLEEVASWRFEVWNEPDLDDFWKGTFEDYMRLYEASAKAVKSVSPHLKIGGPAFSGFHQPRKDYLEKFLNECSRRSLPVDFVSGHPYPMAYYKENNIWHVTHLDKDATGENMKWFCTVVGKSPFAASEIHFDEWNSNADSRDFTHDTAFRNSVRGAGNSTAVSACLPAPDSKKRNTTLSRHCALWEMTSLDRGTGILLPSLLRGTIGSKSRPYSGTMHITTRIIFPKRCPRVITTGTRFLKKESPGNSEPPLTAPYSAPMPAAS